MPVLINNQTNLAENLPDQEAEIALATGSHGIPMNSPTGGLAVASKQEAPQLVSQGYTQPSDEEHQSLLDQAKYGTVAEQAKTIGEGALSGATFGLGTGAEAALLGNAEEQRKRREINPTEREIIGPIAGIAATAPLGAFGAAGALERAGGLAAKAIPQELGGISKIGSMAAKTAVESALIQGGDETSKVFAQDPDASIGNVGIALGMGAILGGGLGAVSPLWETVGGTRLSKVLGELKDRANGITAGTAPELSDAIDRAGMQDMPGSVKTALSNNPDLRHQAQLLVESRSPKALDYLQDVQNFKDSITSKLGESIGKAPEDIAALSDHSAAEAGSHIESAFKQEIKNRFEPLNADWNAVTAKLKDAPFGPQEKSMLANVISDARDTFAQTPDLPQYQKLTSMLNQVNALEDLNGFKQYQTNHLEDLKSKQMWPTLRVMRNGMRDVENATIFNRLSETEAPEVVDALRANRANYAHAVQPLNDIADKMRLGGWRGPEHLMSDLGDLKPEEILHRLTPKNDAELLSNLKQNFPQTAQAVQGEYLNQLGKLGSKNGEINPQQLFRALDKWSPELKQFALPEGSADRIDAMRYMLNQMPERLGPSGTPRTWLSMIASMAPGVGSAVAFFSHHNPLFGAAAGYLGKVLGRDVPDAVRYGLLKYLGEGKPINAKGFKTAVDMAAAMIKGESMVNKASKAVFKSGVDVLAPKMMPGSKERQKLDKTLQDLSMDTSPLMNVGGEAGYYLPDHAASLSAMSARATQYLTALKPVSPKLGPLDPELPAPQSQIATYNRALDIAEQPLVALHAIKNGSLTAQDVMTLKTIYPGFYNRTVQKLSNEMIEHVSAGGTIPYSTRMSLSLFMGQPLDSSMTPQAIMAHQPQPQQVPQQNVPRGTSRGSMKALAKLSNQFQTQGQARQAQRLNG